MSVCVVVGGGGGEGECEGGINWPLKPCLAVYKEGVWVSIN